MNIESSKIKSAGSPGSGVLLYVPFSPRYQESRELVEIYDRGIIQLRESGELDNILTRYHMKDWLKDAERIHKKAMELEN